MTSPAPPSPPVPGSALARRAQAEPAVIPAAVAATAPATEFAGVRRPLPAAMRVSRPARSSSWLVEQVPIGMQQNDFFVRFVSLLQEVGTTLLEDADLVEHLADPTVTPTPMLSCLAGWIGQTAVDASQPDEVQRHLLRSASRNLAHRGTVRGLQDHVEMLSGEPASVVDGGGIWPRGGAPEDVRWVTVRAASTGQLSDAQFVALVRAEIPAHVRVDLWVGERCLLSSMQEDR